MDETLQLAFIGRCDRNHRPAVADRKHRVGLHDTGFLGIRQHLLQAFGGLSLPFADHPPDLLQLRRSVVPDLAVLIDDTVDRPNDLRESLDPPAAEPQLGVQLLSPPQDKTGDRPRRSQRPAQQHDLLDFEETAFDLQFGKDIIDIDELVVRKVPFHLQQTAHLVRQRQPPLDIGLRSAELFGAQPFPAAANRTQRRDLLAQPVETDFLFKVRRIDHLTEKTFETIGPLSGP